MMNFKEYLIIKEDKDEQISAIKKVCKNDFDMVLKAGGSGAGSEKNIQKLINNEIKDTNNKFKDFDDLRKKTKQIVSIQKTKNANTNDFSESESKIEDFYRILYDKRNIIEKISPNTVSKIRKFFESTDRNNDKKIDKEEFQNAIKKIQESDVISNNDAALVAYLMYLQTNGGKKFAITQQGQLTSDINFKPEKIFTDESDKEIKDYFTQEKVDDLNKLFVELKGFEFEPNILKNFKTYENAKAVFNKKAELNDEGFTPKTQNQKELEKNEQDIEDSKESLKKTDAEIEKTKQEIKELEDKINYSSTDDMLTKKSFYIFDVDMPETPEEAMKIFDDMKDPNKNLAMGMVKKVRDEFESYAPKSKKGDLKVDDETTTENIINKILNKNVIKEDYEKYYNFTKSTIEDKFETVERQIEDITEKYRKKIFGKENELNSSTSFIKDIKIKSKLKAIFIDYGYEMTKIIQKFKKEIEPIIKMYKSEHFDYTIKNTKTIEQKGQEDKDVQIITKNIFTADKNDDAFRIAKYMLVNILNKNNNSEDVVKILKQNNFNNMSQYLYVGSSGVIYALNPNNIKEKSIKFNGFTAYEFDKQKARIYKKPADLLMVAGININSLTPDVMKNIKKSGEYKNYIKDAETYIQKANEIVNKVKTTTSVVTEGLFNDLKNKIDDKLHSKDITKDKQSDNEFKQAINNNVKDLNNVSIQDEKHLLNICHEVNLDKTFEPRGNGPEDIAMRQIFKGFVYIINNKTGKNYVTTKEKVDELLQQMQIKSNETAKATSAGMKDGSQVDWNSAVVTSGAADSTYGDGYNYNKKADAIKKKLNCTTYTYSPNSKMKIVRRTFD